MVSTPQEEYIRKTISAEEAVSLIKSGDRVVFTVGREAHGVGLALAARREELKGLKILDPTPTYDFGWFDPGWEEFFQVEVGWPNPMCREALYQRRCDFGTAQTTVPIRELPEPEEPYILLVEVSPPDEKGFCSFGASLWDKRKRVRQAKLVIAEANENLIRTYGDNYVHVSEIDYFVKHIPTYASPGAASLVGSELKSPQPYLKDIAGHLSELIRDGDTIQMGVGRSVEPLVHLSLLDNKQALGIHSEVLPPGCVSLVREGMITGERKTINKGKVVLTAAGGGSKEEMDYVNNNPLFYLYDVEYVWDTRVISAHDNFVAMNSALMLDLAGQVANEVIDGRIVGASGGLLPFQMGALMSKGGRGIVVIASTSLGGKVSRIVPRIPEGVRVALPYTLCDYVVSEYGIASLWGKSLRQRADEMISIAHPDFRGELRKEARKMLYP